MSLLSKIIYISLFFLFLTAIPVLGGKYYEWSEVYIKGFYWTEIALIVILAVIYYHKYLMVYMVTLLLSLAVFSIEGSYVWQDIRIPATFWAIYSGCWLIYFELGRSRFGQKIKMMHPVGHFSYYIFFMALSIVASFSITATMYHGWELINTIPQRYYMFLLIMAVVIPTLTISLLKIIDMIGGNHVFHFFFGTYKRPAETVRVVLFLDMVGSAKIAEKLSPKKSMELISRFIFDSSYIFRIHGGDIVNYTGDGLVVTWPLGKAKEAVSSVKALQDRLLKYKSNYEKEYKYFPEFRVGIHAGKVVISQLGEERLFLGLYGDVVNTAARLEQMNKKLGTVILISEYMKRLLGIDYAKKFLTSFGVQSIAGKEERMEVFTLLEWSAILNDSA